MADKNIFSFLPSILCTRKIKVNKTRLQIHFTHCEYMDIYTCRRLCVRVRIYIYKIILTASTLFINSLILQPTYLSFFDICLLLVILTMAIRNYREKEEKAGDVVAVVTTIYPHIFFFSSSLSYFFFLAVLFNETRKRTDVRTLSPPIFLCVL